MQSKSFFEQPMYQSAGFNWDASNTKKRRFLGNGYEPSSSVNIATKKYSRMWPNVVLFGWNSVTGKSAASLC